LSDDLLQAPRRVSARGGGKRELERREPRRLLVGAQHARPAQPPAQTCHHERDRRVHPRRAFQSRGERFEMLQRRAPPPLDDRSRRSESHGRDRDPDEPNGDDL